MNRSIDLPQEHTGVIKMKDIFVKSFSFTREREAKNNKLSLHIDTEIEKTSENDATVSLTAIISAPDEMSLEIEIVGLFSYNQEQEIDEELKKHLTLFKENAVSILFPYLRTQISILTMQPGMKPMIIPIMNVHAFMKDHEKGE